MILNNHEIVDCDAFCEVILFWVSSKNLFGYFFYSLNAKGEAASTHPEDEAELFTLASTRWLALHREIVLVRVFPNKIPILVIMNAPFKLLLRVLDRNIVFALLNLKLRRDIKVVDPTASKCLDQDYQSKSGFLNGGNQFLIEIKQRTIVIRLW